MAILISALATNLAADTDASDERASPLETVLFFNAFFFVVTWLVVLACGLN
jgi:hypothetical protein